MPQWQPIDARRLSDAAYQRHMLQGVSRTFALTIPALPPPLECTVGNAYLLCRIADTIEDDPALDWDSKRALAERFVDVVAGGADAGAFAADCAARLAPSTPAAEQDLIANTARVIRLTHSFAPAPRAAMERCVAIMSEGMMRFQARASLNGLATLSELDAYCYYVAGVVGEMLTELFCDYSAVTARRRGELMRLAVSFGQGLQMTNILKDVGDDRRRGACWLPRDLFAACGASLRALGEERPDPACGRALAGLIGIAHAHLRNALAYTLLIPPEEAGIRRFCLWALGMAVLTLRKLDRQRERVVCGAPVKISRRSVKLTTLAGGVAARRDLVLRGLFILAAAGLPRARDPHGAVRTIS